VTHAPVPVIDLSVDHPSALVDALGHASCAFVVGHGVPTDVRRRMVEVSRQFFDLPEAEKERVKWPGDGPWYGWQPVHRVANPPRSLGAIARRTAVVYFHYPRLDTVIDVAPSCLEPGQAVPSPLVAGEHLLRRERQFRDHADSPVP